MFKRFFSVAFFVASLLFSVLPGSAQSGDKDALQLVFVLEDIVHPDFEHIRVFREHAEQGGYSDAAMFSQVYEKHLELMLTVQTDLAQLAVDYTVQNSETRSFEEGVADFRAGTAQILGDTIALDEWREKALSSVAEFVDQECETVADNKKEQCAFAHETVEFLGWAYSTAIFKQ